MLQNNLKLKVSLYLIIALSAAMVLLTVLVVKHQQEQLQTEISRHVTQVSEVIVKSTRYAMLLNKRDIAEKIIQDIGKQKGIERVRVLNKDGTIIHSNRPAEIGQSIDQKSEPCLHCHQTIKPLQRVPDNDRWRIYKTAEGPRVLSAMEAIRNEPSCASASCHEHPASQSVLGIVDITYSLDEIDQSLKTHAFYIMGISVGVILLVSISVGLLLQLLIYRPLKDLDRGAKKVSIGNLDHHIPVRNDDEFGRVAGSFNQMTLALKKSMLEMQAFAQGLELKVKERTQELRIAEAEVAQGEKLASIGLLASGIAHELNSPLTGVLTFTSLLRKKMANGSPDAEDLDLVIRETKRCASIIRRLLDFSREKVAARGFFSLNQLIEETVRFIERSASLQNIDIKMDLDPAVPNIWGDADLIKQVIVNILVNAEQAIGSNGSIVVESRPFMAKTAIQGEEASPPMVEVVIKDSGCGISESNLLRIFDPFFTTKEVGKGTGLGLSVSYGIIKAHGGGIKVESVVGEGSTFRLYLPIVPLAGEADDRPHESKP